MSLFLNLLKPFQSALRHSVETFIRLETADDETTLVAEDGSLITFVRIDGSRQVIGDAEYKKIIEGATLKIGARFDRQGHALQVFFVRDAGRIRAHLESMIKPSRTASSNMNLEMDDVYEERVRHLSKFLSYEECYFVLWTRPSVLTKVPEVSENGDTGNRTAA